MADELPSEGHDIRRPETLGLKQDWPLWIILAADWCLSLWLLPRLPKLVPLHWGFSGQPDGWGSPLALALPLPIVALLLYLVLLGGSRRSLEPSRGSLLPGSFAHLFRWLVVSLLCGSHIALLMKIQVGDNGLPRLPFLGLALGFILVGNLLPRVEPGERTAPSPERRTAWRNIYRNAGRYWVAAGVFQAATVWLPSPVLIVTVLGSTFLASLDPMLRIIRLKAYRPSAASAEVSKATPVLSRYDVLPLGGLIGLAIFRPSLPTWLWIGAPILAWSLLFGEAVLLEKGEVRRVSAQIRGWMVLGLELALWSHALLAFGHLIPILASLSALLFCGSVGQYLAWTSSPAHARGQWGEGPALWDPADPRVFSPKGPEMGWGWYFNFARANSWILFTGILGFLFGFGFSPKP